MPIRIDRHDSPLGRWLLTRWAPSLLAEDMFSTAIARPAWTTPTVEDVSPEEMHRREAEELETAEDRSRAGFGDPGRFAVVSPQRYLRLPVAM